MKTWFKNIALLGAALLVLASCEKDEVKLILGAGVPPTVSASGNSFVITETNLSDVLLTLNWTKSDYSTNVAVNYTVQVDKAGNNFAAPMEYAVENLLTRTMTGAELNTAARNVGLVAGTAGNLEVRIKSEINPDVDPIYSSSTTISVNPLVVVIIYPTLHAPGSYQGWAPDLAPTIQSAKSNNKYEGYVYFADANAEFKLTDAPDWNNGIFGDSGDGTSGTIASPGNNFKVTDVAYYQLIVDITASTWSAVRTDWGIIGSATPTAWDSDTKMTYDAGTQTLTITIDLIAGEIKFRANSAWDLNLGDTGADGIMEYGGDNIAVAEAGNYTVTLDLRASSGYTYTLTKN